MMVGCQWVLWIVVWRMWVHGCISVTDGAGAAEYSRYPGQSGKLLLRKKS